MTYDSWKARNPQDEFLGSEHEEEEGDEICPECEGTGREIMRPKPWDDWDTHFTGEPCPYCNDGLIETA